MAPTYPLTAAERFVDFPAHASHIMEQRQRVELGARPAARRLAYIVTDLKLHSYPAQIALASSISLRLGATASFGFNEARKELAAQRKQSTRLLASWQIPDAGVYSRVAQSGLKGVRLHAQERARRAAGAVAYAAQGAAAMVDKPGNKVLALAAATDAALRSLHNNVLELVGETLNMGRSAGALSLANPPEFALRSEQLDQRSCEACEVAHGEIYQVDSPGYYDNMPPEGCYGGGRCRGIYVFSYGLSDVRGPDPSEADLALIRKAA